MTYREDEIKKLEGMRNENERLKMEDERLKVEDERLKTEDERLKVEDERLKTEDERLKVKDERLKMENERLKVELYFLQQSLKKMRGNTALFVRKTSELLHEKENLVTIIQAQSKVLEKKVSCCCLLGLCL